MKKYLLVVNVLLLLLTACKKDIRYPSTSDDLLSFSFTTNINPVLKTADLSCTISDSLVTGTMETPVDRTALVATFETSDATVTVNGVVQVSGVTVNNFTNPVIYTVTSKEGEVKQYVVKLATFTGLPIMYITSEAPIVSEEDYVNGTLKIDGNLVFTDGLYNGNIQIRGRGHSTWYQPKKPYKIKLASKSSILGMPADKEWALLANYLDKGLMRNDVAYELSERVGLAWTPRRRFVEVILNGEYEGNYLLCETVKVAPSRLNITTMDGTNPTDTTGGFEVECDEHKDGTYLFYTPVNLPFVIKSPDVVSDLQFNYVKNYFTNVEGMLQNKMYSDPEFQATIDADSFIEWFLVNEIMRNRDAVMYSSVFFYKDKGGKLSMGPVWDFDLSSGAYTGNDAEGWYLENIQWIGWPIANDPAYRQKIKDKWNSIKSDKIATILAYIDGVKSSLQSSQAANFKRWDIMNTSVYDGSIITGSYDNEVASLRSFLEKRIAWLDTEINKW
jgi:hypothetical protein